MKSKMTLSEWKAVFTGLSLLLSMPFAVQGQVFSTAPSSSHWSGDPFDLAHSYSSFEFGDNILNQKEKMASQDSNVIVVGRWAWGVCLAVEVQDSHAYVGNGGLFQVFDVSNPSSPEIQGELLTPGIVHDITISGQLAFVAVGSGLMVIDISIPSNPRQIGWLRIVRDALQLVSISGSYAYLGTSRGYLIVVDISRPENPGMISMISTGGDQVTGLAPHGTYVYVGTYDGMYINVIDVSDPENPDWAGQHLIGSCVGALTISGDYLYVGTNAFPRFQILDISTATHPQFVGGFNTVDQARDIEIAGSYGFLSLATGFSILDLSDKNHPREVAFLEKKWPSSLAVTDGYAHVATGFGYWVVDISVPTNPQEVVFIPMGDAAQKVAVSGSYAYVACGEAGLWILDISNPQEPRGIGHFDTQGFACDVAASGQYVFLVNYPHSWEDTSGAAWIVDVSDPVHPKGLVRHKGIIHYPHLNSVPTALDASENHIFVTQADSGLSIIDISDPEKPFEESFLPAQGYIYDVTVSDRCCYIAESWYGLRIVDISDPAKPIEIGLWTADYTWAVTIVGNLAYIGAKTGLSVLDVSDPSNPVEIGYVPTEGGRSYIDIAVIGGYAYMAYGYGLQVIDVSKPSQPRVVGYFGTRNGTDGVAADENYIYLAVHGDGLWLLRNDHQTPVDENEDFDLPSSLLLFQNYPNPFNLTTTIKFQIPDDRSSVSTTLRIYNILGQEVRMLVDSVKEAGHHTIVWDGKDDMGRIVSSGLYICSLRWGEDVQKKRLVLVK